MLEITTKLRRIIADNVKTKVPVEEIGVDESLVEFGINSFNFVRIIVGIEAEFGIVFDNETLRFDTMDTLNKITAYITSQMK